MLKLRAKQCSLVTVSQPILGRDLINKATIVRTIQEFFGWFFLSRKYLRSNVYTYVLRGKSCDHAKNCTAKRQSWVSDESLYYNVQSLTSLIISSNPG